MDVLEGTDQRADQVENIPVTLNDKTIHQASGSWAPRDQRDQQGYVEGDRLFRQGRYGEAYQRYFDSQREIVDRGAVYFRQAYALIAMGRFSHAVAKLKRGLQVDPCYPRSGATLDEVFGLDGSNRKAEFVEQVTGWTKRNSRDPDRLFLLGVILYFDEDPRSTALFHDAQKLTGNPSHLLVFIENSALSRTEPVNTPEED